MGLLRISVYCTSQYVCMCLCVHFMCVQKAAPTRIVSAMRAASVGATQPSTDKLKVQTNSYDFTPPCISNVADGHFCETVCSNISV